MKKNDKNYSKEELEIINYVENNNPKSEKLKKQLYQAVQNKTSKRKALSIRLFEDDLRKLKTEALKEGMPYQGLISSIIHKYLTNRI